MMRSRWLFGVASMVVACAAEPKHPLCYGDGSPACGNIGQTGRATRAVTVALPPTVAPSVERVAPQREYALLYHPVRHNPDAIDRNVRIQRPIVHQERPLPGNVMGKGGRRPQ